MLVATVISLKITKYQSSYFRARVLSGKNFSSILVNLTVQSNYCPHYFCSFLSYGISVAPRWDARSKSDEELSITEGQKRTINIMECF